MAHELTRSQVAELLAISVATVRRLEGRELHPALDDRGRNLFDRDEVDRLAVKRSARRTARAQRRLDAGEIAARAFELFDQQVSLHDCVTRLRQTPEVLVALWKQWRRGNFRDWIEQENQQRVREQAEEQERRENEEFARQMKEIEENNRRLLEVSARPRRTK